LDSGSSFAGSWNGNIVEEDNVTESSMRVLFTSDWQCEWETIELCQKAVDEILHLKEKLGFQVLVHCGDLKHAYNPVDTRVIIFWQKAITQFKKIGLEVLIDLGNHDRVGMHVDKQNWFPILRKAGATCFDDTGTYNLEGTSGSRLAFLPFRQHPVLLKREAYDLARSSADSRTVLIFHGDIKSAKYNVLEASTSIGEVSVKDLCAQEYLYCIGGHIHLQQNVQGNVWYVGSPFCTDWGEANQKKGYLLYDAERGKLSRVYSEIPGWYDPSWPGFEDSKPSSWVGARVRIKVPVADSKHINEELQNARMVAQKRFRDAEILIIPDVQISAEAGHHKITLEHSDRRKLEIYTDELLQVNLRKYRQRICDYMAEQLKQVGGLQREGGQLEFHRVWAENFLSFKELDIKFEPGLTIITGENRDRKGKSNGSGKSSYLQPLAVALFGQTFKGQKHDHWMHRWVAKKEESQVKVWMTDAQGRKVTVRRGRRPKILQLRINGSILESGNRPEEIQKLVEQTSGYTWETLSNAIYVDQTRAHLMLSGTEGERKGFLTKLQNLERFERAQKRVHIEKQGLERRLGSLNEEIATAQNEIASLTLTIRDAKQILALGANVIDAWKQAKSAHNKALEELQTWEVNANKEQIRIKKRMGEETEQIAVQFSRRGEAIGRQKELVRRLAYWKKMKTGTCSSCQQPITAKYISVNTPNVEDAIRALEKQIEGFNELIEKNEKIRNKLAGEFQSLERNQKLAILESDRSDELIDAEAKKEQYERQQQLIEKLRERRKASSQKLELVENKRTKLTRWLKVVEFAEKAFSRTGLPAFLNAQICPLLNKAAQKYSELFTQSEIQVRFEVDEQGAMDVQILNISGGEGVEDQSEGEMKIASLITSFAIREAAPKTNLLILDEPGHGLDALSAKQFARGLKQIVKEFKTVLLTSHNEHILGALESERLVTIVKENKVSRVK
jgi:Herelleviridae exonuclease